MSARNSPSGGWEGAVGLDLEAIAVNADDAHAFTDGRRAAARAPFAVADANTAVVVVDRGDHRHHFSDEPSHPVVQEGVGAVGGAIGVEAAADQHRNHGVEREQSELRGGAEAEQHGEQAGRHRRRAEEYEEEAGRDHLEDQQQDAADQPQPAGIDVQPIHSPVSRTVGTALARVGATALPVPWPNASLASSPIPPSVPMSWVASTGNRMVLALGEVANLP